MNRSALVLGILGALLIAVLFYLFAWKPKDDRIAEIDEQIETVEQETAQLEQQAMRLREVRASAPEVEAAVVAAESIVPRDVAMPALLRQMQLAADESGADLLNVTASRPTQVEDAQAGLAAMTISAQVNGGYYQLVDFLRRIEDPTITPRGVVWDNMTVTPEEYPTLAAAVSGRIYALLPAPPAPEPEPTEEGGEAGAEGEPAGEATPGEGAT